VPCAPESRKSLCTKVHSCDSKLAVSGVHRVLTAKSPKFHRFCLQTAVNHENAAAVGFGGKIGYRY
jgi:hypothetical protein